MVKMPKGEYQETPNIICRFCLKLAITKIDIFTEDFAKIVEILTCIKIKPDDGLPQVSCRDCAIKIKQAFLLRRQILISHRFLTKQLLSRRSGPLNRPVVQLYYVTDTGPTPIPKSLEKLEVESSVQNQTDEELSLTRELESINNFANGNPVRNSAEFRAINENVCRTKLITQENDRPVGLLKKNYNRNTFDRKVHKRREPGKLYCVACNLHFSQAVKYRQHMSTHRFKTCQICNKQVKSGYLKRHNELIHESSPVMCESCGISCKNRARLKLHSLYYHKFTLSVCEDCGKSFKTRSKLVFHQRRDHSKERNFKCDTCGKTFFLRTCLTKHINLKHKKLRLHMCEYCGKGFSGNNALRTHVRQHTNETPYQCCLCGASFRQRVSLRTHLKNRHKVKEDEKFFCDKCQRGFASAVALDVHSRLHAESIKCPICSDSFAEMGYLEQHVANVHQDVEIDIITSGDI